MSFIEYSPFQQNSHPPGARRVRLTTRRLAALILAPILAAGLGCGEEAQPPTAPTEPAGAAASVTAGHKVVNSLADPGDGTCNAAQCTLREAINDPASTEISFTAGVTGPITLARPGAGGGTLVIEKSLTITGPSAGIVIRRRSTDPDFRIVRVGSGVTVQLTNLTMSNGKTDAGGAGITNFGTLTLARCTVAKNLQGGGIDNHGTLTLNNSTVADNQDGGVFQHDRGPLTVTNSTVSGNGGRGISNSGGRLVVTSSLIAGNSGGGIADFRGTTILTNVRIVGNSTPNEGGGVIGFNGGVTLTNSTVAGNSAGDGGGIANRDGGVFTIAKSTIVNNSADQGGGIFNRVQVRNSASVTLTNSTVSGNEARQGGGIFTTGFLGTAGVSLINSTVARNSATQEGGGIEVTTDEGLVSLTNSLVAQNRAPVGPDVLKSPDGTALARFSLIGNGNGSGLTNTDGNQVGNVSPHGSPIDPRLGPLADNGGPTRTHALLAGSPALDAASTPDCPGKDQRGVSRPQGPACDIGSYERE